MTVIFVRVHGGKRHEQYRRQLKSHHYWLFFATFLLNTGRARKTTKVCKECLIFLNDKVLNTEGELSNLLHIGIYQTIFRAYCIIPDHTKAQIYGRKLLDIYRQCDEKGKKTNLTVTYKQENFIRQQLI